MEFAKNYASNAKRGNGVYGLGLVRSTSFGRKRVALSDVCIGFGDSDDDDCISTALPKRQCCDSHSLLNTQKSMLEDLPQELLIRILCGVEHDDLKRLFFVSKAIREAALIAKQSHFAYTTPQKTLMFRGVDDFGGYDDLEAPNAPRQSRAPRIRMSAKKLSDISVALFASDEDVVRPMRGLSSEMETDV